jgi:hypothetical protein
MIVKMKLIIKLHEFLLENVDQTHEKQKRTYVTRKWHIMFHEEGEMFLKMWKLGKNKSLLIAGKVLICLLGTKTKRVVMNKLMEQKYVFPRITKVRLGKKLNEICRFTMRLEA